MMGTGASGVKAAIPFGRIRQSGEYDILCSIARDAVGTDDRVHLRVEAGGLRPHDWERATALITPANARRLAAALVTLADAIEQEQP